jgi:hypothetical protein
LQAKSDQEGVVQKAMTEMEYNTGKHYVPDNLIIKHAVKLPVLG